MEKIQETKKQVLQRKIIKHIIDINDIFKHQKNDDLL
jgi:hypothetical protein